MTTTPRYIVKLDADERAHLVIDTATGETVASFYWDEARFFGSPGIDAEQRANELNYIAAGASREAATEQAGREAEAARLLGELRANRARRRWNEVDSRAWQLDPERLNAELDAAFARTVAALHELGYAVAVDGEEISLIAPPVTLADIAARPRAATPVADPWNDGPEPYSDTPMSPERAAEIDGWLKDAPPALQPIPIDDPEPTPPAPTGRRGRVLGLRDWQALSHAARRAHLAKLSPAEIAEQARLRARARRVSVATILAAWSRNGLISSRRRRAVERATGQAA